MNFEELGQALREERERRGLSVAAVMEATKISRTNIEAMEAGDRSTLPHPVYAKGFVKSYARFLELDADELCMVVDREYRDDECEPREPGYDVAPHAEKAFHGKECSPAEGRRSRLVLIVALLFLLGVVGLLAFSFSVGDRDSGMTGGEADRPAVSEEEPPPLESDAPLKESAPEEAMVDETPADGAAPGEARTPGRKEADDAASSGAPAARAAGADTEAADPPPARQTKPAATAGQTAPGQPVAGQAPAPDRDEAYSTTATDADKQKYDHVVIIRATTPKGCWIGVWQGDETNMARDFVLREGEPLRLMFNSPRRIRIGNVAGVTVTYNGKPYPLENARGNIQTLRFGME
jgi:cytoskeleton protein RodZ